MEKIIQNKKSLKGVFTKSIEVGKMEEVKQISSTYGHLLVFQTFTYQ